MKRRTLVAAAIVLCIIAVGLYVRPSPPSKHLVVSIADNGLSHPMQPYSGEHPSIWDYPEDAFDYPIRIGEEGPVNPNQTMPLQYPFICNTLQSGLGQPLIDNQEGLGTPVFAETEDGALSEEIIGYSKDCRLKTRVRYLYKSHNHEELQPLENADNDIVQISLNGERRDFIVRLETGTINRFIYGIMVLAGDGGTLENPSSSAWNRRAIYQLRGGVGVGRRQGKFSYNWIFRHREKQLSEGYAILYSSANHTSNHYNIWLATDTAERVKRQFESRYGKPLYTVGVGGSGGALQQYLMAQNRPGLLDAAIPQYSYPDMITQTTYAFDCELLEYYFDVLDRDSWTRWEKRSLVEGMNARSDLWNTFARWQGFANLLQAQRPLPLKGVSECTEGWRGLTPLVFNPRYTAFSHYLTPQVESEVHWTYWDDMNYIFGSGEDGFAHHTWDNVGIQYGLESLKSGDLTSQEFLKLNASIGGWKNTQQMQPEKFWIFNGSPYLPPSLSIWSDHNMRYSVDANQPAKRSAANIRAIEAAYRSGQIFLGQADIPIIDVRHYLEDHLDMHHSVASFASRVRIQKNQGHARNHIVWMSPEPFDPTHRAFEVVDQWMLNLLANPEKGVLGNRPADAVDSCFDQSGSLLFQGDQVWDGDWNEQPPGACQSVYPHYSDSRQMAGGPVSGDILKCHLQSVDNAIAAGVYGDVDMSHHRDQLMRIYPDGVCDYSKGDQGRPSLLLAHEIQRARQNNREIQTAAKKPESPTTLSRLDAIDDTMEGGSDRETHIK